MNRCIPIIGGYMSISNLRIVKSSSVDMVLVREMPEFLKHLDSIISLEDDSLKNTKVSEEGFYLYTPAYPGTTENVNGYYNRMFLEGKTVLTVVGSGAQVFEAVLRGAKKVDAFDISMTAIMVYYLKEAALKSYSISYNDYINLFYVERSDNTFLKRIYNILKGNLNPVAISFWDKVFLEDNPSQIMSRLFIKERYLNAITAINKESKLASHLNKENFLELRRRLIEECEINVRLRDVKELDDFLGPYDYIILSNIFQYQKGEDIEKFKEAIERYRKKLTPNGEIIVGYAYNPDDLKPYDYPKKEIRSRDAALNRYSPYPYDIIMTVGPKK